MEKVKKAASLALNLFIAVAVPAAWSIMLTRYGGILSATGWESLKYFTVLSNLLMGGTSLISFLFIIFRLPVDGWVTRLKYTATVGVALTFFTVMIFLGPLYGYGNMFKGANLWLHMIVPLAAMADFLFLWHHGSLKFRDSFIAIIPMAVYGIVYFMNILINGRGEHFENDWYSFAAGGTVASVFVLLFIATATWGMALLMRWVNMKLAGSGKKEKNT